MEDPSDRLRAVWTLREGGREAGGWRVEEEEEEGEGDQRPNLADV